MWIRIGYDMTFTVASPTPMLLATFVHPSRAADLARPERLVVEPEEAAAGLRTFTDGFGNHCGRLLAPRGALRLHYDNVVRDDGAPDPVHEGAAQHPVDELPDEALPFLLASRYCEVDLLSQAAWDLFGNTTAPGWGRVAAICDWVHGHVTFGYEYARPTKTALDVYNERQGVCRDFTHLAVTLCRCMNIPARYCNGYLGDIGVPPSAAPMDFNAWFEAYLGGRWHTFDARHNVRRVGRVLIARGRDATDIAMTTAFGPANLQTFEVYTEQVDGPGEAEAPHRAPAGAGARDAAPEAEAEQAVIQH